MNEKKEAGSGTPRQISDIQIKMNISHPRFKSKPASRKIKIFPGFIPLVHNKKRLRIHAIKL